MTDADALALKMMLVVAAQRASFLEIREPVQLLDLVVEVTNRSGDPDAIGWLVSRRGPAHSPTELVIRTLDGRDISWQNAEVRRLSPRLAELARKLFPDSVPRPPQ